MTEGFDPRDVEELSSMFAQMGEIDPLTAMREQAARDSLDPVLAWRARLSQACQDEGVAYHWFPEHEVTTVGCPGGTPQQVPDVYLEFLCEHGARLEGVAALLKAVCLEPNFRPWGETTEEES